MQRMCRRRAACLLTRRVSATATPHASLSVRAQWLAVPVATAPRLHRCLSTKAADSSQQPASPLPQPARPPYLRIGLALLASTAALYAISLATSTARNQPDDSKKAQKKDERVKSSAQVALPTQVADAESTSELQRLEAALASLLALQAANSASSPEPVDSTVLPAQQAGHDSGAELQQLETALATLEALRSAQSTGSSPKPAESAASANLTTAAHTAQTARDDTTSATVANDAAETAPVATATAASDSTPTPATPASHSHSPPDPATAAARPISAAEAAYYARLYSAPVDEHPTVRNLRILTANRIDEVLSSSPPFLLYLFEPGCSACSLFTPIIHALAYALDTSDEEGDDEEKEEKESGEEKDSGHENKAAEGVRVYAMNDATDYKPGFLLPDEENRLPILKFFPQSAVTPPSSSASSSSTAAVPSVQYTGSPHLSSILRFLHAQTSGAFDLDRALARARSRLPALRVELLEKGAARLEQSEDWALYLHSPCGPRIHEYSLAELMSKYVEGESGAEDKYDKFVQCMEEREEDTMDYFEMMAMIANETLQQLKDKREKRRRQGAGKSVKSDQTEEEENTAS